jgi:hypothetical protein
MAKAQHLFVPKAHLDSSNCSGSGLIPVQSSHKGIQKTIHILLLLVAVLVACGLFAPRNRLRYMSAIAALRLDLRATDSLCNKQVKRRIGYFFTWKRVVSTRHLVHTTDGNVIGEWGMRKWMQSDAKRLPSAPIYILHDSLRLALLETTRRTWCGKVGTPISRF